MRRLNWIAVLLAVVSIATGSGHARAKSLALIIGNDGYHSIPTLDKARSDASGYTSFFRAQGFETSVFTDLDSKGTIVALAGFLDRIEPGDTVAFVFSGHGWSDGRENYLLPVDIPARASQVVFRRQSIAVQNGVNGVVDEIVQRGAKLALVVIDACRNNPFNSGDRTRAIGVQRGLVSEIAPEGTFIAFSAGAGQTALDSLSETDASPYSVFTRYFLSELEKPQDLQSAFKATQLAVSKTAKKIGHDQRPAYYDEVVGAACLSGSCNSDTRPAPVTGGTDDNQRLVLAIQAWALFKDSKDIAALTAFADEFGDTAVGELARARIRALKTERVEAPPEIPRDSTRSDTTPEEPRTARTDPAPLPPVSKPRHVEPSGGSDKQPEWCHRASTRTEKTICETPRLAELDVMLSRLYFAKRRGVSTFDADSIKADQRDWIRARDRCRSKVRCMERLYLQRINELQY